MCGGRTSAEISNAAAPKLAASRPKGRATPNAISAPANGGPTNWFITCSALHIWPLARSRSLSATICGIIVWAALSRNTSAVPKTKCQHPKHQDRGWARLGRCGAGTCRVDQPDHPKASEPSAPDRRAPSSSAAVGAVRPNSDRQREQEPRQATCHHHERDQEGISGQKRRQPRKGQRRDTVTQIGNHACREGAAGSSGSGPYQRWWPISSQNWSVERGGCVAWQAAWPRVMNG
jgi:hypothetical protein